MKKIILFLFCCIASSIYAERIELMPFGDMENWTVRYVKEAKFLGGQTKTLYCLAPTDTIWENGPYYYGQNGNPWATSNAYANIIGIEKAILQNVISTKKKMNFVNMNMKPQSRFFQVKKHLRNMQWVIKKCNLSFSCLIMIWL